MKLPVTVAVAVIPPLLVRLPLKVLSKAVTPTASALAKQQLPPAPLFVAFAMIVPLLTIPPPADVVPKLVLLTWIPWTATAQQLPAPVPVAAIVPLLLMLPLKVETKFAMPNTVTSLSSLVETALTAIVPLLLTLPEKIEPNRLMP